MIKKFIALILPVSLLTNYCLAQDKKGAAPDFVVIQYAGSIGYFSVGTGYNIFKNRGRVSAHFGSVPVNKGGPLNIVTGKIFYQLKSIRVSDNIAFHPANIGLMLSYHFGDNFKLSVPNYFRTDNYYWWHTAMRLHLGWESSVSISLNKGKVFKKVTGYIEFNSNDLYIVSYVTNSAALKLKELIKIGVGTRLSF